MITIAPKVELALLVDSKGVYGFEWPRPFFDEKEQYVLRPDKIAENQNFYEKRALHALPSNCKAFRYCREYEIVRTLCDLMVAEADLVIGGRLKEGCQKHYWGLARGAQRQTNWHIGRVIEEAADKSALKLARRFPYSIRWQIYRVASQEPRLAQLAEAFPVLAVHLVNGSLPREMYHEIVNMIVEGRRLRDVAAFSNLPIQMRRVAPGAALDALPIAGLFADRPDLLQHMPSTTGAARRWLCALHIANSIGGPFVEWTARNAARIGGRLIEVQSLVLDLGDFVKSSYQSEGLKFQDHAPAASSNTPKYSKCVTRRFDPSQSLQTVMALSEEWHEAVATMEFDGAEYDFPAAWCPATTVAGFEIVPITNNADLYREGAIMHHCVSTHSGAVMSGDACVYSIQREGKRVATAELLRDGVRAILGQVRGPCNTQVDKAVTAALRTWERTHLDGLPPRPKTEACRDFGREIPF